MDVRRAWLGPVAAAELPDDLDELVRRAQADGTMRTDVSAEDIIDLLDVFTCHPDALPASVAAQPTKYLHLVLDGMQAAMATPVPAPHD